MLGTAQLRLGLLIGLFTLAGCHVMERSKECQHLAQVMNRSAAELAPPLTSNPSADSLNQRAITFKKLGDELKAVELNTPELKKARGALLKQLNVVSVQLKNAALAVGDSKQALEQAEVAQDEFDAERKLERERKRADPPSASATRVTPAPVRVNPAIRLRAQHQRSLRQYTKAKTDIENAQRKIGETMERLQQQCH